MSKPYKQYSLALGRYVVELLKYTTVEYVAQHLGLSWDTAKGIHKEALRAKFKKRKVHHLRRIGVDEIAVKKGHNYLTVVVDLDSGEVVYAAEGRTKESLLPFMRQLKRAGVLLEAVAMDMWPAYYAAVTEYYSQDVVVYDHYHIVADYGKTLDELRRQEAEKAPAEQKTVYRGTRYLLLAGNENIQNHEQAQAKLNAVLELNKTLFTAYVMKEDLRRLWDCSSLEEACIYMNNWFSKALASNIPLLIKFAQRLKAHEAGILNYFVHHVTTARVEGTNNKIKVLKRQAYGYRDMEYFKLRIYNLHCSEVALVG